MKIGLGHDEHATRSASRRRLRRRGRDRRDPRGPLAQLAAVLRAARARTPTTAPPGSGLLDGKHEVALRPKFWEAELYDLSQGVQQTQTSTASAGRRVGSVSRSDWWAYRRSTSGTSTRSRRACRRARTTTAGSSSASTRRPAEDRRGDGAQHGRLGRLPHARPGAAEQRSRAGRTRSTWSAPTTRPATCSTSTRCASTAAAWRRVWHTDVSATPSRGAAPLATTLTADEPDAPAGATYTWDFGDGRPGRARPSTTRTPQPGAYEAHGHDPSSAARSSAPRRRPCAPSRSSRARST